MGNSSEEDENDISEEQIESENEEVPITSDLKRTSSLDSLLSVGSDLPEDKKFKRGVVYISFIPQGMTPTLLRTLLSQHAPVGRLYMQKVEIKGCSLAAFELSRYIWVPCWVQMFTPPATTVPIEQHKKHCSVISPYEEKRKRKKNRDWVSTDNYSEGWVEFLKKRHAKQVSALLNNQPIGGKKKDKFYDYLWNLKYLSRFKWVHLVERLSFERAVMKQKMQNEISQAKRVANFFKDTVEREEWQRKKMKKNGGEETNDPGPSPYVFAQRETHEEKKAKKTNADKERETFLKSLFA